MSAAHATVMAVTAASVATAHRVKKVLQNTPTTAQLLSTATQRMTTRQTSKARKRPVNHMSHANRVNRVSNASLAANVQSAKNATSVPTARRVTHPVKKHNQQRQRPKPLHAKACRTSKRSHCLWQRCKPWPKAAVWNGSTPIQTASPPCKQPSQPSQSPCMCHASVHRW